MKHCYLLIVGILCASLLYSCDNEEEVFHSLDIDVQGIELRKDKNSVYLSDISPSEIEFTITGKGKYADMIYVTSVIIDGVPQEKKGDVDKDEPPFLDVYPILEGEWGRIHYKTKEPPYVMQFLLKANNSEKPRVFEFQLGYGYWCEILRITQKGM